MALRGQAGEDLVGMPREGFRHATNRLVVTKVDRLILLVVPQPAVPGPHQGVLQDRQLVGVVAEVVEEALHQAPADRSARHPHRSLDGALALVPAQAGDEVLALVDRFRQIRELGTVAQEIRAHRDHHVDRDLLLPGRFQQELHEVGSLFLALPAGLVEAEDLLELIDHHEEVAVLLHGRLAGRLHQPEAAAHQGGPQVRKRLGVLRVVEIGLAERPRQVPDRIPPRLQDRNLPEGSGPHHAAGLQFAQDAAADQRGLAASRTSHHRQEAAALQAAEQLRDLLLPPEKQVVLIAAKRAQPRERVERSMAFLTHRSPPFRSSRPGPGRQSPPDPGPPRTRSRPAG